MTTSEAFFESLILRPREQFYHDYRTPMKLGSCKFRVFDVFVEVIWEEGCLYISLYGQKLCTCIEFLIQKLYFRYYANTYVYAFSWLIFAGLS